MPSIALKGDGPAPKGRPASIKRTCRSVMGRIICRSVAGVRGTGGVADSRRSCEQGPAAPPIFRTPIQPDPYIRNANAVSLTDAVADPDRHHRSPL